MIRREFTGGTKSSHRRERDREGVRMRERDRGDERERERERDSARMVTMYNVIEFRSIWNTINVNPNREESIYIY